MRQAISQQIVVPRFVWLSFIIVFFLVSPFFPQTHISDFTTHLIATKCFFNNIGRIRGRFILPIGENIEQKMLLFYFYVSQKNIINVSYRFFLYKENAALL